MGEKFKKFSHELKRTLSQIGSSSEKIFDSLSKSDKEMQDRINKSLGSASKY